MNDSEWIKTIPELGALLSVFAAFMFFVRHQIWVVMPAKEAAAIKERADLMSAHKETINQLVSLFERHVEACDRRCEDQHKEIMASQEKIRERIHNLANVIQGKE